MESMSFEYLTWVIQNFWVNLLFAITTLGGWIFAHPYWSIIIIFSLFLIFYMYITLVSLSMFIFPYKNSGNSWSVSKTNMSFPDGKTYQQIFAPFRPSTLIDDRIWYYPSNTSSFTSPVFLDEANFIDECFKKSIQQGNYVFSEEYDFESKKSSLRINRVGGMIMMYQKAFDSSKLSKSEKKKERNKKHRGDADSVESPCTPLIICGGHIDPTTFKFKMEFITYSSQFDSMIKNNTRLENTWINFLNIMFSMLAYAHRFNLTKEEKNLRVEKEEDLRTLTMRNLKGTSFCGRTASSLYFTQNPSL